MPVFSSPPCLCKLFCFFMLFFYATFIISFVLSRRLLLALIKMKGSFDVRFWSPGWPNTTYPYRIDKYINKEIWFQATLCLFCTDQSGEVLPHVDHQQLQLLSQGAGLGHQKLRRSQQQPEMVSEGWSSHPLEAEHTVQIKIKVFNQSTQLPLQYTFIYLLVMMVYKVFTL